MVDFLGKTFNSETERNAFAFENKSALISDLEEKKNASLGWRLLGGFIVGLFVSIVSSSWLAFFIFLIGFPWFLGFLKTSKIEQVEKFAQEYEELLNEIEKTQRVILDQYTKRYFTEEQQYQQISDLINLINHKNNLNLTEEAGIYILAKYKKEQRIKKFDREISKLKDKSEEHISKIFVALNPEIDYENEEEYQSLLDEICEYLDRKNLEYDIEKLTDKLVSRLKSIRATNFEEKLSRDSDKRISVDEISHLSGFEFEELIGQLFRKSAYKVKVTKKSGDQGADLIVEKGGLCTAIQTKKYAGSVGNKAVQEVVAAMKYYDCDKAMVITTGSFTKAAFELASRNGVKLVDKKGLDEFFDSIL